MRRFSGSQRIDLFLRADGRCQECGEVLGNGWHADHVVPWSLGGATDVANGQALCGPCNLRKGTRVSELREWQEFALKDFVPSKAKGFLTEATPGAGKTRFTCEAIKALKPSFVVIVVPTTRLRYQWAASGHQQGLDFKPDHVNGRTFIASGYIAVVTTYPALASQPDLFARYLRNGGLLVGDEIHHCGQQRAWGDAFGLVGGGDGIRVLGLSGTPFRSDNDKIPFVQYVLDEETGDHVSKPDYRYGMADAIRDHVIRPPEFGCVKGDAQWVSAGRLLEVGLEDVSRIDEGIALKSALRLDSEWLKFALHEGEERLARHRDHIADAKGIVFANDQDHAKALHPRLQRLVGRKNAVLAISDDGKEAQQRIEDFAVSGGKWIISVRMVAEGVDISKLLVGIHATSERTPLAFMQRLGRVVRTRGLPTDDVAGQNLIPSTPTYVNMARRIELETAHIIQRKETKPPTDNESNEKDKDKKIFVLGAQNGELGDSIIHGTDIEQEEHAHAERLLEAWNSTAITPIALSPGQMALFIKASDDLRANTGQKKEPDELWRLEKSSARRVKSLVIQLSHVRGHSDYSQTYTEVNHAVGEYTSKGSSQAQMERRERILIEWLERENAGV